MALVSVLMAARNEEAHIEKAIDSILQQSHALLEFIIVDDGSDDGTADILRRYEECHSRIRVITNEQSMGLTKSLNTAIANAKGKYLARQDADDWSVKDRIEKQFVVLKNLPDVVGVSSVLRYVDEEGRPTGDSNAIKHPVLIRWGLLLGNILSGHGQMMFRASALKDVGGYDENYAYAQDYELYLRLLRVGEILCIPEPLYYFRKSSDSISATKSVEQFSCLYQAMSETWRDEFAMDLTETEAARLGAFLFSQEKLPLAEMEQVEEQLHQLYQAFIDSSFACPSRNERWHIQKFTARLLANCTSSQSFSERMMAAARVSRWSSITALRVLLNSKST